MPKRGFETAVLLLSALEAGHVCSCVRIRTGKQLTTAITRSPVPEALYVKQNHNPPTHLCMLTAFGIVTIEGWSLNGGWTGKAQRLRWAELKQQTSKK